MRRVGPSMRLSNRAGTTLPRSPSILGAGGAARAGTGPASLAFIDACAGVVTVPAIGAPGVGASIFEVDGLELAGFASARLGPSVALAGRPADAVPKAGSLTASSLFSSAGWARGKSQSGATLPDEAGARAPAAGAAGAAEIAGSAGAAGKMGVVTTSFGGAASARNSSRLTGSSAASGAGARELGAAAAPVADFAEGVGAVAAADG